MSWLRDAICAIGAGAVVYGCWAAYRPMGWVIGGAALVLGGWQWSRMVTRRIEP